jgi:hypothetical protein
VQRVKNQNLFLKKKLINRHLFGEDKKDAIISTILGSNRPAAGEDQVLQEADRGGGGDRSPQPRQVSSGRLNTTLGAQLKTQTIL